MLIRPEEMKHLLKSLPVITVACESMKRGLETLVEDADEDIYSACMNGPVVGGGLPGLGAISNKTARIAMEFRYASRENVKQLQRDVTTLCNVIEGLNSGIKTLTRMQRTILGFRYQEGAETPWKDVAVELKKAEVFISVSHAKRIFNYSIARLISAAQISVETYQEVMGIMKGRGE
ncbi:hypothetical protein CLHUN_01950 [Ruminiclostridium hungatei]|uniref:Phage transcriptional regulator, RinA family n=1 Tax=Ruminiclostridium hungatei TaxID=48256 RepID=A0A1V4SR55_RUMHU|nr:hypothetical protein [Ruminiclostridium hungatei]OPX46379.1 hypothetical protein CLHUN_01950 [Ruminiclostridium hungatei]